MNAATKKSTIGFVEFIALMALIGSLVALSIDAMLPALPQMGRDLKVQQVNDSQLIISLLLSGMAVGQLIYGPLSDSIGRKPTIYAGFILYMLGCLLSYFSQTFSLMLIGRGLQGIGIAGPRVVSVALVRDQFEGRAMARVMSFIMVVFMLVPAIAPLLGQGILWLADWRAIFGTFIILTLILLVWFAIRQPETLAIQDRIRFSGGRIASAVREVCTTRVAIGYTIGAGFIFGAFLGYLNSAQQVFQEIYGLGTQFPLYFAVLSLAIGTASYLNARLVMIYGMRQLCRWSLLIIIGSATLFWGVAYVSMGKPDLWGFMGYFLISFFCMGILFGNLNALAMEPLGHIAGIGAAVIGSLTNLISVPLGLIIGRAYNETVLPLVGGFALLGALALLMMQWVERTSQDA